MTSRSSKTAFVSSIALVAAGACSSAPDKSPDKLVTGQSDFVSAPPNGVSNGTSHGGGDLAVGASNGTGGTTSNATPLPAAAPGAGAASNSSTPRDVEETDLYRFDPDDNRLYYLNAYRGLMVFDVSDIDHPQLLGRSAIYGEPIEMVVHDGIASVVVADWYGQMDDGTPFHGSIVRGIDARDPANIAITGEAYLGGVVLDTRVVGDVLYAVTEKYPYYDYWYGVPTSGAAVAGNVSTTTVSVSSVNLAGGKVQAIDDYDLPGSTGIFNVTSNAIVLASNVPESNGSPSGATALQYLDISDPAGRIAVRGTATVSGYAMQYGADNGRWTLDFADDHYAHVVTSTADYSNGDLVISTADFGNPDAPVVTGMLSVKNPGYSATTRFDSGRLYLTPNSFNCYDSQGKPIASYQTPLEVFDVSNPKAPALLGATQISGQISLMMPNGQNLFVLGNDYDCTTYTASPMALAYFDMSNPVHPRSLGSADFGKGWTYSPAASTFKAFTLDAADGLVVLPFSGWDPDDYAYNTGVQLFAFDANSIRTSGVGHTRGWVERGIFVNGRLLSLSDLSLSVIDYSNPDAPQVVNALTLARNVVNARPAGDNLVEVSSDFWDNDEDHSELRVIPKAQADETTTDPALATLPIAGTNPTVFHNGGMSYVVSNVQHEVPCTGPSGTTPDASGKAPQCYAYTQAVTVVDLSSTPPKVRGAVTLPDAGYNGWGWGWGWYACDMVSWYYGADVVQVGTKLAFRRWLPQYANNGQYVDSLESLFVVDATNPDAPTLGSTVVTDDPNGWWGNLRAIGNDLYAAHYDWVEQSTYTNGVYYPGRVGYYIDKIDLSNPAHPSIGQRINVPGFLVGGSEDDTSVIYTMDYEWDGTSTHNELAVLRLDGDRAYLLGHVTIPGYTGNVFVQGSTAYFSAQTYTTTPDASGNLVSTTKMQLYQVDLSDPANPAVLPSADMDGWGWLLAVEGNHAFVTSGWYNQGIDIFKLTPGQAPVYDQFVRARGWWTSSLAVDADNAYLASGYWGVQTIPLSK